MRSRLYRFRYLLIVITVLLIALLIFAATFISGPAVLQAGAGYADPAGHSTAPIPEGWTIASTDQYGLYTKNDVAIYLLAVPADEVITGVDAALKIIAPEFDREAAALMNSGDAPAANGVWKENVYQAADGRVYYTDTQLKNGAAVVIISTAPNLVTLMRIVNDAHAVIVGVDFAGEEVTPTLAPTRTPAPLPQTVVTFPALTGEFAVGRRSYVWVDAARNEVYTDAASDKRALTVTVWYPAADCEQPAPYLPEAMQDAIIPVLNINAAKVTSHACADAAVAENKADFPVLVFSHGNQSSSLFSAALLEEIASHGYVIFGIDHSYNALLTTLPDGAVVRAAETATPETAETLAVRVADVRFAMGQITALNTSTDALAGRLNLAQVGFIGHSYGGATVAEAARLDERAKAVVVMDVPLRGEVATMGLAQPILLLDSERLSVEQYIEEAETLIGQPAPYGMKELLEATNTERDAAAKIALETSAAGYHLRINGTRHGSFTDIPFLLAQQPVLQVNLGGFTSIEPERAWRISSDVVLAFFGRHLRGEAGDLLDNATEVYQEIVVEG